MSSGAAMKSNGAAMKSNGAAMKISRDEWSN
jgi:hypothetical protein